MHRSKDVSDLFKYALRPAQPIPGHMKVRQCRGCRARLTPPDEPMGGASGADLPDLDEVPENTGSELLKKAA